MGHDPGGFGLRWRQLTGSDATLDNAHVAEDYLARTTTMYRIIAVGRTCSVPWTNWIRLGMCSQGAMTSWCIIQCHQVVLVVELAKRSSQHQEGFGWRSFQAAGVCASGQGCWGSQEAGL